MKLERNSIIINNHSAFRIGKRNAYHQAGHVAAIHRGNMQKKLPAVHFQFVASPFNQETKLNGRFAKIPIKRSLKLEGGRLLPDLPCCYEVATQRLTQAEKQQCQIAFEADGINLLAGSLAEAKYVALRDGEVFNANLVYLGALRFYGGSMDLEIINNYLECLFPENKTERQQKLAALFLEAYSFINDRLNWLAITGLAEAIYRSPQDVFTCDELISLLESAIHSDRHEPAKHPLYSALEQASH